ncbi:LacI family DNA-binding transcriptional regulator [Pseudoruegeria sp. SHC-113]|uniref:LacI family DNA-binding transcriptional regulator n=1 Tax=Pseudoruegeria sp. SHC-113 TaxID=2855439 RepID=UPI0021BB5327|nr:LacI family DNA-binding transcriptional regulator [Pseudoruegeria sp. SHC-113]MCT8159504.1 LacI family DNA-binding transcriptional regulator [Pseudoruegeria sp. SHC-113]
MAKEKVTSAEVAARAGVSQSAVSRVFTPGASASEKTVQKVRKAAEELGYRPNVLARAMVSGRSRIIGLVVAYLENQFYPVALEMLSNALQKRGYHILIFTAPNSTDGVDGLLEELMDYQVDGIIAASVSMSSDLAERAQRAGIPVVLFNRGQGGPGLSYVTSANVAGGRKAAEFLLAGGHERIAHIAGWQGSSTGRDRQAGFLSAMEAAGQQPFAMVDGMYSREVAMACTYQLMGGTLQPDAIFVGNDHMAFAVIDALREGGHEPGRDISVVGYDDVPLASWGPYKLTTLRQPVNRMVEATVDLVLRQIEEREAAPEHIEIEGELILRSSARIPEGWTK